MDFLQVLITVLSLTVLAVPGFLLVKTKLLPNNADTVVSAIVLYACQPMLMIMGFQKTDFNSSIAVNMLIVAGLSMGVHLLMIGLMYIVFRGNDDARKNCLRFASVFGNCGYMGFPFLQTLFSGQPCEGEMLVYASVVVAVFNVLNWSIGIFMMTGNKKDISVKKAFLNPTVIGIAVGLLLFFTLKTPLVNLATEGTHADMILTKLAQSMDYLSNMVTPLAMFVIGVRLANISVRKLFLDKYAYVTAGFKLIVMSILTMAVVAFLPIDVCVKYVLFFLLSMPSATSTVLFAVNFGGDGDSASVYVMFTTVLSILTIPLMYLVFSGVFGIVI